MEQVAPSELLPPLPCPLQARVQALAAEAQERSTAAAEQAFQLAADVRVLERQQAEAGAQLQELAGANLAGRAAQLEAAVVTLEAAAGQQASATAAEEARASTAGAVEEARRFTETAVEEARRSAAAALEAAVARLLAVQAEHAQQLGQLAPTAALEELQQAAAVQAAAIAELRISVAGAPGAYDDALLLTRLAAVEAELQRTTAALAALKAEDLEPLQERMTALATDQKAAATARAAAVAEAAQAAEEAAAERHAILAAEVAALQQWQEAAEGDAREAAEALERLEQAAASQQAEGRELAEALEALEEEQVGRQLGWGGG